MFKKLICLLFGHKYYIIRKISPTVREVGCYRCHKEWGMNDEVHGFVELDDDIIALHDTMLGIDPMAKIREWNIRNTGSI